MSNIIKSCGYIVKEETKVVDQIGQPPLLTQLLKEEESTEDLTATLSEKQRIIGEAMDEAQKIVESAQSQSATIKEQTRMDIEQWWNEKRLEDTNHIEDAKSLGYSEGLKEGHIEAERNVLEQYSAALEEAGRITEEAIVHKQQIINESEPFLIELATSIAERIIGHELDKNQEYILGLVRQVLTRRLEHGIITLCVSPAQYNFMYEAREELTLAIDAQAELNIIADNTVKDHGCIVRSSFGSIDSRIDTQLNEIKKVLIHIAQRNEEVQSHGELT